MQNRCKKLAEKMFIISKLANLNVCIVCKKDGNVRTALAVIKSLFFFFYINFKIFCHSHIKIIIFFVKRLITANDTPLHVYKNKCCLMIPSILNYTYYLWYTYLSTPCI